MVQSIELGSHPGLSPPSRSPFSRSRLALPGSSLSLLKAIAAETGGCARSRRLRARWPGWGWRRRHRHGRGGGEDRGAVDGDLRRHDDLGRACVVDRRRGLAAVCGAGPVHGISWHRRHERAFLCVCESLVRSPPRLGARASSRAAPTWPARFGRPYSNAPSFISAGARPC